MVKPIVTVEGAEDRLYWNNVTGEKDGYGLAIATTIKNPPWPTIYFPQNTYYHPLNQLTTNW
ncbi:hypothetical protein H6F32_14685 [Anabaena sp. FACHB-1237]|uniref:hypothetical protein n=1 Tax=Anabaena sp. FACHB-1237 TaxID=2692769 RepID=UPI0016806D07|nr:hypothetical protein [Anabaena sp. FACHB-1237]MBD2138794.1 hypothetical protein [Anabaena sp. FACHB-1237]